VSTEERSASVTAEYVKAEVLAKVLFTMSEKDPALLVTKAVADYYSLHRNLRLDFINGKPKKAVENLVSVIRPATLKTLIESKLEMDKSELKKDFLEFVKYLEEMAIIHDEHCHVVEQNRTGDSGMRNNGKGNDVGGSSHEGASNKASDRDRTKSRHGRSSESTSTGKQSAREPPPCLNTKKCAGEKHYLSDCPHTGKDEATALLSEYKKKRDADKKKAKFKTLGNNRATADYRDGQTACLTAENLGVKVTGLVDTGSEYSAIPRSAVEDARKRGFPLKVEVLPEPIMLKMATRGEGDKKTCSATGMLMSAVTITTPSGPLCMRGLRQIIVEEDMDHPLVKRPVLDEMDFVASQHLDSVRDKFHLHDFSHIDEELLNMGKQPSGALSKLLIMPADIPEFIEDLPDVLTLAKKKNMKRREQTKPNALNEDQCVVQRSEVGDGGHDMLQLNVKFASLKEQALYYGEFPDDDPIYYYDEDVGQGSQEELADAVEGFITSTEKAGISRDGVQSLRQMVTECKDVFGLNLGADPPTNVKLLVIKLRDGAESVPISARKYAPPQLKFGRDKIRELEDLGSVYKNTGAEWASPPLIIPKPWPDQYRMTIDLRVPNASTKRTAWPMPNLQDELQDLHGSDVFATLDFVKAIGRYLCTKSHKTVNRSPRQMECTHRHVYYMEQEMLRSICTLCLSSLWTTSRATEKYG
jgi:hypothetical protein